MVESRAEASLGFPADCPTNAYVLEGFAHLVYIVSTAAGNHTASNASSTLRLRNAERDLRSQSLLVSLDSETNELFTFHRLVDFTKDGKNIYGRLAMVLRQNQCIISFKAALRATGLLEEEHTRVRGILLAAVFSTLKPILWSDSSYIPLGMRSCVRPQISNDFQSWDEAASVARRSWQLNMVDLQLLPHGQILVLNILRTPGYFQSVSDALAEMIEEAGTVSLTPGVLCLAPTGQMARYIDGQVHSESTALSGIDRLKTVQSGQQATSSQDAQLQAWKQHFLTWLAEQDLPVTNLEADYWVEVEVLMSRNAGQDFSGATKSAEDRAVWHRVFWPAQLSFYTHRPKTEEVDPLKIPGEDPIALVQEWLLQSSQRSKEIARGMTGDTGHEVRRDDHDVDNLDEDIGFGNTPQMHNTFSAGLPPSQMMYPTPPDVPYTQATPGMSSVDGVGLTPAEASRTVPVAAEQQHHMDTMDHMDISGVGTGTYDEDLFEDLPTTRFGAPGATEEPDWDFFEPQNTEMAEDQERSGDVEGPANDLSTNVEALNEDTDKSSPRQPRGEEVMLPSQLRERVFAQGPDPAPVSSLGEAAESGPDQVTIETTVNENAQAQTTVDIPLDESVSPRNNLQSAFEKDVSVTEIWKKPPIPSGRGRRRSQYDSSEDLTAASNQDERYAADGAFWFDALSPERSNGGDEQDNSVGDVQPASLNRDVPSPHSTSHATSGSDTSSYYEVDDVDLSEEASIGLKRKWTEYEQMSTSPDAGLTAEELDELEADARHLLNLLRPMNLDQTWMVGSGSETMASTSRSTVKFQHSAMAAQILVDQLTQASTFHDDELALQSSTASNAKSNIVGSLEGPYGKLEPASLTFPTKSEHTPQNEITCRLSSLERHQLHLQRADKKLSISSTALSLWETLNLQPNGGRKDVQAFCVHPATANVETGCVNFLERLGETYVGCNLGAHHAGQIAGTSNNGLVPWSDHEETVPALQQCCERLGTALARLPPTTDNFVIYMIAAQNASMSPALLVEAFCVLFEAYVKTCNKQHPVELALQIVPIDFVASPDTLVVRSTQEYQSLAVEVYNRFPPRKVGNSPASCGSAVVLGESPRRRVRFDMAGQNGNISETGAQCLHVSYAYSNNLRWIVAVWTDERGFEALTMCYPIREAGRSRARPRLDIIRDIWGVSRELMTKVRRHWRLVVARDGHYDAAEVNEWATQFNSNGGTSKCTLVLVSVDLDPALTPQTPGPQSKAAQGATPQQPLHNYGTPASTPQASTTSPDQHLIATPTPGGSVPINAPTPPEMAFDPSNEADLTVQDAREESWAMVLPFGLRQSCAALECRSALLSGYLLKRRGIRDNEGLAILGVHLIHASISLQTPAAREELLKDILGQYRGLVTLARTRGCIDPVHDVVPWHVATAIKGARVLHKWM